MPTATAGQVTRSHLEIGDDGMSRLLALVLVGSLLATGCGGDPANRGADGKGGTPAPRGAGAATTGGPGTDAGSKGGAGGSNTGTTGGSQSGQNK